LDLIPNAGVWVFNCSAAVHINVPEAKSIKEAGRAWTVWPQGVAQGREKMYLEIIYLVLL